MATVNNSVVRLYQQWANSILCEAGIAVSGLEEFQSGALLTVLLDLLWPQADLQGKLQQQGLPDDLTEETTLRCIQAVLDYISSVGIRCQLDQKDIAHGDVKSLLDLLWILILHFTVHSPDKVAHQRTVKWGKKKLLEWCGDILDEFCPDLSLNLSANLCQSNYLTKLICAICDVQEDSDPVVYLRSAFSAAEEQVGICKDLLDASNVTEGNVEEHGLLVYLALLRRKAKLLENLPPQWTAGAEGGGVPPGWNLPPEAMQAMGIDAGDYVMYAIVEETYLPPNYLPSDAYPGMPPQLGPDDPRSLPTAQISEIHSSDEEGSVKGAEGKPAGSSKLKSSLSSKAGASSSGDGAFDEMGRLRKKSSTPKKRRTVSFSDSMDSQEKMNQSYNNLLLSDSPDEFFDTARDPKGKSPNNSYSSHPGTTTFQGFSEYPSTTYTTVPGGFIVTSTMVVPPGHPSDMFYSYPYAGYYPGGAAEIELPHNSPRENATDQAHTPEVETAVSHSQSIRDEIKSVIADTNKSRDSQGHSSSSASGQSDLAVRGSDNDASQMSLDPLSSSAPVSDEEGMMILSTSQSDQEPGPEMNLHQPIEHPFPRLTDDWMSSTFNTLLNTGSEVLLQTLAKAGGRSGLLSVMEDPTTDPAVAEAIHQAINEEVQRQERELRLLRSETTNSNAAMRGSSDPSRSSMEVSTSDDDNIDELLDLLERIGQEGENMKVELYKSHSREAYLQQEYGMEEDNMQGLMQRLTDEIQVLQDENRRMQKQIKDMRDNHRSDKVSIMNLMSTIEDLRSNENNASEKINEPQKSQGVSTSTMTDRRILANTQSQTQSSISHMRDKVQQISPLQTDKGTQILKQVFQRSTLTSTQGLIKTRNAGIQARPMQGRFNVGLQVGPSSYRAKHVATQTGSVSPLNQSSNLGSSKLEDTQLSLLRERIGSLETTLHNAQNENSKLTDRLEEALIIVKENLQNSHRVTEVSAVESENQKLRQQLDIVQNEKNKLVEDLSKFQETPREPDSRKVSWAWESSEGQDTSSTSVQSEAKSSRPKFSSPLTKKTSQSQGRPQSPSSSRPSSPSSSRQSSTSPVRPLAQSGRPDPARSPRQGRPSSATGSREGPKREPRGSPEGHNGGPAKTSASTSPSSSPSRSRGSSNERSPTRPPKEDVTAKVQRELEKLFPRNRSSSSSKKDSEASSKQPPADAKPLLDADKVKGMSVDELRKKRLAMLVDSYTSKRVTNILQGDKPESQSNEQSTEKKPSEMDGRPASARGRRPSYNSVTHNQNETLKHSDVKKTSETGGQLPPWAQRRETEPTQNLPNIVKHGEQNNSDMPSTASTSPTRGGRKSPLPEGSTYSSPPWRPPGPTRPLRPTSGHSDSCVSELSLVQTPHTETDQSKKTLKLLPKTASPAGRTPAPATIQQDARNSARSALQRRLKSHLTNVAATAKPQVSPRTSYVSPTRGDTRASQRRPRSSSSSSSSSVSDLIASLKERSRPLKTSSREDLRSSSPARVSKVTADGTFISISEINSPRTSDAAPQSAGRRRRLSSETSFSGNSLQTDTRTNLESTPRTDRPRSALSRRSISGQSERTDPTGSSYQSSQNIKHSRLTGSQSDLTQPEQKPKTTSERWAEPKRHETSTNVDRQQQHGSKPELFRKRAPSPRSQRIRSSLAHLTRGHLGSSERLTRSTSDLLADEEKVLLNDPGNIRPPSPSHSDSSSSSSDLMRPVPLLTQQQRTMTPSTPHLPPLGTSGALNQSFSMIRPPSRPPSRAAVFEEEADYVDQLIKKYTAPP